MIISILLIILGTISWFYGIKQIKKSAPKAWGLAFTGLLFGFSIYFYAPALYFSLTILISLHALHYPLLSAYYKKPSCPCHFTGLAAFLFLLLFKFYFQGLFFNL